LVFFFKGPRGPLFLEVLGTATFSVVLVFGTVGSVSKSDASSPVFSSTSVALSAAASASLSSTQICRLAQKKSRFGLFRSTNTPNFKLIIFFIII
jgi:hypothetical protein